HSDASVRLTNCVNNDPQLGSMTIREYLENPELGYARSLKTQNMGAKSAGELKDMVFSCVPLLSPNLQPAISNAGDAQPESPIVNPRDLIISALYEVKFPEALFYFDLSGRLKGVLERFAEDQEKGRQPAALLSNVGHVVNNWDSTTVALKRLGN